MFLNSNLSERKRIMNKTMLNKKYVTDQKGNRVGVLLDLDEYHKLIEEIEELESIRAYDKAKASGDEIIPFEQAVSEIESNR